MEMQMELSYVFAVVITGLVVVFLGLVLLIAFINIIGAIFKSIDKKRKDAEKAAAASKPSASGTRIESAPVIQPAADSEDEDEIIAVISAAVAMMSAAEGKAYRVRSVRTVKGAPVGNAWASAALREATRPF